MSATSRTARGLLPRFLMALAVAVPAFSQAGGETGEIGPVAVCLQGWGSDPEMSDRQLSSKVADLGAEALPELLGVLADARYAAPPIGDRLTFFTLDTRQRQALLEALDALPRSVVAEALVTFGSAPASPHHGSQALKVLGEWGGPTEFELLVQLATRDGAEVSDARTLREAYEDALTRLIEQAPEVVPIASAAVDSLPETLRWPSLRALALGGDRSVVLELARIVRRSPQLAPLVLGELGRAARRLPPHYDGPAGAIVCEALESGGAALLVPAASAAGALEDSEAMPLLLPLLDHVDPAVSTTALVALERIAGQRIGPGRVSWERWYWDQVRWWKREAPNDIDSLRVGTPTEVVAAVNRLAKHPLYRHHLAPALGVLTQSAHPGVALVACAALGQLRSAMGAESLVAALRHHDPGVQRAAQRALARILGRDLGPDPAAWRELLP